MNQAQKNTENNEQSRHVRCKRCNKLWNISKNQKISKSGYVCPHCTPKEKAEAKAKRERVLRKIGKWISITMLGIAIYELMAEAAYIERGYRAFGGEILFIPLPLWWLIAESTLKETKATIIEAISTDGGKTNV